MANDHQFQAINLCNSWWNSTVRNPIVEFDYPSNFSCSTGQLLTNFTGNTSFNWADVSDDKSAPSCDESPGSGSNTSSITLNDIPPYSSDPMLDFSLLSPTMSWNQPFLSNDQTAQNNLHGMLPEDAMISESNQIQNNLMGNSSLNQGLLQDKQHRRKSDDYISSNNSMGLLASEQMLHGLLEPDYNKVQGTFHESNQSQKGSTNYSNNFHGRMDMQSQAVMDKVQQLVKVSDPKHQLQFTNETAFWNPLASTPVSLNMHHSMPNQLLQSDHSSISSNHGAKPNFGVSTSNSTSNKKIESEPALKKPRIQTPSPLPTFKVRKEKLGDRVTALQQLVSPFGKTDTASVLHEAIDYIKFLHDQVRALSTPYLKNGQQMQQVKSVDKHNDSEGNKQDLRSRGLCLVPISSTYPVATETPLDFWTPIFGASYM